MFPGHSTPATPHPGANNGLSAGARTPQYPKPEARNPIHDTRYTKPETLNPDAKTDPGRGETGRKYKADLVCFRAHRYPPPSGLDQIDDSRFPIPWLAEANSPKAARRAMAHALGLDLVHNPEGCLYPPTQTPDLKPYTWNPKLRPLTQMQGSRGLLQGGATLNSHPAKP